MTTSLPRIIITVKKELLDRIDDFRYKNRIPTRSEAVRNLLEKALGEEEGLELSKKK